MRRSWVRRQILVAIAILLAGGSVHAGDGSLPWDLGIRVYFGQPRGSESLRADIEAEVLHAIQSSRCFRRAAPSALDDPAPPELLFRVMIDGLYERTDWDVSIAGSHDPDAPPDQRRAYTVRVGADFVFELKAVSSQRVISSKRFHRAVSRRPMIDEDSRAEAREKVVEDLAGTARNFVCKAASKKGRKELAKAGLSVD